MRGANSIFVSAPRVPTGVDSGPAETCLTCDYRNGSRDELPAVITTAGMRRQGIVHIMRAHTSAMPGTRAQSPRHWPRQVPFGTRDRYLADACTTLLAGGDGLPVHPCPAVRQPCGGYRARRVGMISFFNVVGIGLACSRRYVAGSPRARACFHPIPRLMLKRTSWPKS